MCAVSTAVQFHRHQAGARAFLLHAIENTLSTMGAPFGNRGCTNLLQASGVQHVCTDCKAHGTLLHYAERICCINSCTVWPSIHNKNKKRSSVTCSCHCPSGRVHLIVVESVNLQPHTVPAERRSKLKRRIACLSAVTETTPHAHAHVRPTAPEI